jgi:hypothetical protein
MNEGAMWVLLIYNNGGKKYHASVLLRGPPTFHGIPIT